MDVTEQIEEQKSPPPSQPEVSVDVPVVRSVEETLVEQRPVEPPPPAWPTLNPAWLRLGYTFEFWIALLVIFTVWSQVGGQGHLDLIAWYIKLCCSLALAYASVKMTSAMVENARVWNRITVRWFLAVVAIVMLAVGITYWYHLHEISDEPDTDQNTAATLDWIDRGRVC